MEIKQVFSNYNKEKLRNTKPYRYCPMCSQELVVKDESGMLRQTCSKCGFIFYRNPLPAISVLIVNNGEILLGQRGRGGINGGNWCLPCGFIEFDEDFLTAAKREVLEETGLHVKIKRIINIAHNFLSPDIHSLVIVLLAEVITGQIKPGDDLVNLKWVKLSDPLPEMAFDADTYIINRFQTNPEIGISVDPVFA